MERGGFKSRRALWIGAGRNIVYARVLVCQPDELAVYLIVHSWFAHGGGENVLREPNVITDGRAIHHDGCVSVAG